ncbi:hypothetical protein LCI18_002973 [Fusarium solani-melongenae]|uniref:Uncharacterized protein n=1 Tax=Fusarium solani subsp. cucurbitae TaxID=2747967 RepID=A0ACD3YT64_FUSSC|nr:hypothetical protein LCI18_002973 [Fusarium solani-melongenae]
MVLPVRLAVRLLCLLSAAAAATSNRTTLFKDGTVITFNKETQENEILYNTSILIVGDTVTAIISNDTQSANIPAEADVIPAHGMIISPGFIDTHRHTWQTTFRTLSSNITLADLFSPDDFYLSQMVGLFEALNAGITSLLDHPHNIAAKEDAAAALVAHLDSGARVFFGYSFDSLGNFSISARAAHFREMQQDSRLPGGAVSMGVSCDSWSAVNQSDLEIIADLDGIWNNAHRPSLFQELGLINQSFPIVLSHAAFIQQPEYELLKKFNHYISITPESEMHFGHTNYESDFVMDQASLGVDTHTTYSGDIVTQARMWLQSVRLRSFKKTLDEMKVPRTSPMSVNQAFHLATHAGAQALRRQDLGIIAVGAKADLVLFDGTSANMVGWRDPIAAIILHSNMGDVKHVMVNGKLVKRDGLLTTDKFGAVMASFSHSAERIQKQAMKMPYHIKGGHLFNPSSTPGYPDRVDAVRGDGTGY